MLSVGAGNVTRNKKGGSMSSFFDEMGRRAYKCVEDGDIEGARKIAHQVYDRMDEYFKYIAKHSLKSESAVVENLTKQFLGINKDKLDSAPVDVIGWELHEMGHNIGRARIKGRGGIYFSDNPYFPGHGLV